MTEPPTVPSGQHDSAADMAVTDALRAETTAAAERAGGTGTGVESPSDAELITAIRAGDSDAFGELYARHVHNARRLARSMAADPADVDDLVAESFAKVLAALRTGQGPDLAMRAYLLSTLRHICYDRARRDRRLELAGGDLSAHGSGEAFADPAVERLERRYAGRAFAKLPERWRLVLWHTAVEGESPAQVAPLLGLTPNGVSALAYRARERLRQLYLKEHINETAEFCHWAAERLGAHVRDALAPREIAKVQAHLDNCDRCRVLYVELAEVSANLRGVLAWVVLGTAAPGYLGVAIHKAAAAAAAGGGLLSWWNTGVGTAVNGARRGLQKLGPRNTAVGGGAVAAVAVAILVASLTSAPSRPPTPPAGAAPPAQRPAAPPDQPPAPAPKPAPTAPRPPTGQPVAPRATPSLPVTPHLPAPEPPFVITPQRGGDMTAGSVTNLLIAVRAAATEHDGDPTTTASGTPSDVPPAGSRHGRSATFDPVPGRKQVTMDVTLPEGVRLSGVAVREGWTCVPRSRGASCSRRALNPGESTTARLPVLIGPRIHGRHPVTVNVTDGRSGATTTFHITIAPHVTIAPFAARKPPLTALPAAPAAGHER